MNDAVGNPINVGDHVAVAFSYSRASVGHLRFGTIAALLPRPDDAPAWFDNELVIKWDKGNYDTKEETTIKYAGSRFLVIP